MTREHFLFYRPVSEKSGAELYEAAREVLSGADFIRTVGQKTMHLTLLNERMLKRRRVPESFLPHYGAYDNMRRNFVSKVSEPWNEVDIPSLGAKARYGALTVAAEKTDWLIKERTAARRVAGIPPGCLAFDDSEYYPHITLGRFDGSMQDWNGFYECEALLIKALSGIDSVSLSPLRLKYGQQSWEFQRSQILHNASEA